MTAAQREYLAARAIDPHSLKWAAATDFGREDYGASEACVLPDGRLLLADGKVSDRG
jgi:hypothetical protein